MIILTQTLRLALMAATGIILMASGPALADSDHGKGHGRDKHVEDNDRNDDRDNDRDDNRGPEDRRFDDRDGDRTVIIIENRDRDEIRRYLAEDYHHRCTPGLAKKHNGCRPPGQVKKHYRVGERLPDTVHYVAVQPGLLQQLSPVQPGYQYVQVDQDVLLISQASKKIIDAMTLLSAVGQ